MTNLYSASQGLDSQHREPELILNGDLLLVLLNESGVRGWRKVLERPIRDSASSITLCRNTARREGDFFGFCVAEDGESNSPKFQITFSHNASTSLYPTHLNFVRWTRVLYGLRMSKSVSYFKDWLSSWAASGGNGYAACVWTVSNTKFAVSFVSRALGKATE